MKTPSDLQVIRNLSGGNQQKVVLGRNLISQSQILLCDEPTIGVDVGAKSEIYKIFETLTAEGITILLVSSYLPEVMGLLRPHPRALRGQPDGHRRPQGL